MAYEITIAKTGEWRDRLGRPYSIGSEHLDEYAQTYDPKRYRAPLIFRHNTHGHSDVELSASKFAFGFPQKLKRVGDEVKAVFSKISPLAKQWIKDGNAIAISPSFYEPNSPGNPTPGKRSLRHIALLGAEPPAIAGMPLELTPTELSATEDDETCFSFAAQVQPGTDCLEFAMGDGAVSQLFQRLREYLIVEKGAEEAEKILPADALARLVESASYDPTQYQWSEINALRVQLDDLQGTVKMLLKQELNDTPSFSQGEESVPETAEETRNPRELELEAELAQARAQLEENRRKEVRDFVAGHEGRGAVFPGEVDGLVESLLTLEEAAPIELSAPDGSKKSVSKAEALRSLLNRLKPAIVYGEVARGSGEPSDDVDAFDFQAPEGQDINPERLAMARKARAYMNSHPGISFADAYRAVGGR